MPEELTLNNSLAILGDEDLVLGFKSLGFKVYAIKGSMGFKATLDKVLEDKIAVCLLQENIYEESRDQINTYRHFALPIFIPFSKDRKTELLDKIVKEIRLKATGAF